MKIPNEVANAVRAVTEGASAHSQESQTLDFKVTDNDRNRAFTDLAEAAACFANADGGYIVVGVKNTPGGLDALTGTKLGITEIRKGVFEKTAPNLAVEVSEFYPREAPNARLVVIRVDAGTQVYSVNGRVTQRMKDECKSLPPVEVSKLYLARLKLDVTAEPTVLTVDDTSPSAVEIARRRLRALPEGGREIANLPLPELLRNLKLIASGDRLNRGGALLFTEQGLDDGAMLVYVHRPRPTSDPDFSEQLTGAVIDVSERCLDLIRARRTDRNVLLPTGQQITVADFPDLAVREAIANALVHRDFRRHGPVFVEHDPETLRITSPGGFVPGVTPGNVLTGEPKARNPVLAEAARAVRLGERLGVGVDRMYRSMITAGGDPPIFEDRDESVSVRLNAAGNPDIAKFIAQLPTSGEDDHEVDVLIVVHELCRRKTITAIQLQPLSQRTLEEADAVLERLCGSPFELLEPTRQTANSRRPTYRLRGHALQQLGRAVQYHRRSTDDIDRRVVAHVAEYNRITNATVRNLVEVSVTRASAILRDLCERDILVRVSQQSRGPSVEYAAGPNFDAAERPRTTTRTRRPRSPSSATLFDA